MSFDAPLLTQRDLFSIVRDLLFQKPLLRAFRRVENRRQDNYVTQKFHRPNYDEGCAIWLTQSESVIN